MLRQTHAHVLDAVHSLTKNSTRSFSVTASSAQKHRLPSELEHSEGQQLPRWLRRQNLQKGKAREEKLKLPIAKEVPIFRSKHLTPAAAKVNDSSKEGLKLLEPHVLSQRLKKLCDRGKLDAAVALLNNSPLDAQNTPVWNTLIWETMKAKRYKLAYSLYVDMKRRGHIPTARTYQTMLNGLARIEDFSRHTQQLKNAHSIYESFTHHLKSVKRVNPADPELSVDPLASYIKILGDAKYVFYSLDPDGPLTANPLIYTSLFQVLALRPDATIPTFRQADARLLWNQAVKASKRNSNFVIDAHLATSAIAALARGQTSDHDLGFQIARDFFGLCPPGTSRVNGSLFLSPQSLSAILRLCNTSNNHDLCIEFFGQVKRRPTKMGSVEILDRRHMEEVLRAYQASNVPASGYQSLQTLEWMLRQELTGPNGTDWNSATRTFDLMTGYRSHDFMDGAVAEEPRLDRRGKGRNFLPTSETMSNLVRTAYATRNRAHMRQCLRMLDYLGLDTLLTQTSENADESRKTVKNRGFYVAKLAQGIVEMVSYVSTGPTDQKFPEQLEMWRRLSDRAKMELRESGEAALIPTSKRAISETDSPLVKPRITRGRREHRINVATMAASG
ncbi:hypothetical protein AN958_10129 [Leucoagaricus sp. SymC.cos]|nr:hypothetical protein AN958_10129 [Leucoagaricus sp. SymC.cos]